MRLKRKDSQSIIANKFMPFLLLFFANIALNNWITLKAFVLDDLSVWSLYNNSSSFEFIFNLSANKIRPIANLVMYFAFESIGTNIHLIHYIILLFQFVIAYTIYCILIKFSRNQLISILLSIAYLASRFAYYQAGQALGLMESLGQLFAVLVLYFLLKYLDENKIKHYLFSTIYFLLSIYSHERYIILFPLYCLVLLFSIRKDFFHNLKLFLFPFAVAATALIGRIFLFGNRALDGTGGTSAIETFNIKTVIKFFISSVYYVFGINAGPTYLNGIEANAVPEWVYIFNMVFVLTILILIVFFIVSVVKGDKKLSPILKSVTLIACFIIFCLLSASITIRVEMRWIYTPMIGCIILIGYLCGVSCDKISWIKNITIILTIVMVSSYLCMEIFYRTNYRNLYYWGTQSMYNSLYQETIESFGGKLSDKSIIIVDDVYQDMKKEDIERFYKQFGLNDLNNFVIIYNIADMPSIEKGDVVILYRDIKMLQFTNITDLYVKMKG